MDHSIALIVLILTCWSFGFSLSYHESKLLNRNFLNGINFRVSGFNYPPCFTHTKLPSGNYSYEGLCKNFITYMAERFGMTISFVSANISDISSLGLGPALVKQLVNAQVDFIPWAYAPTPELLQQIDVTIPLKVEDFFLLQAWPKEESRLTVIVRPFSPLTWVIFLATMVGVIFSLCIVTILNEIRETGRKRISQSISNSWIYTLTILTSQGNSIPQRTRLSLRILVGTWCLTMLVFGNAYTSTLTSYLTVPKFEPIINSLTELAASSKVKMTVDFDSDLSKVFLRASAGPYKTLGDSLRNNPKFLITSPLQGMSYVVQKNAAYPVSKTVLYYFITLDMKASNICRMTASGNIPYIQTYSMGLPKNGPYNKIFNNDFQYLWENGLLNFWSRQYSPKFEKCMIQKAKPRGKVISYSLYDLSSAFAIFGVGLGMSLTCWLTEICVSVKKRNS